jgi:predicted DNA-binding transcriptional regulator AlpA
MSPPSIDDIALIAAPVLRRLLGVSEMSLWRWIQTNQFPQPDVVMNRRRFWRHSTVETWITKDRPNQGV